MELLQPYITVNTQLIVLLWLSSIEKIQINMDKWLQMVFNSLASNPRRPHDELEMPEDALLQV